MKIVENSPNRLVMKEGAITKRLAGAVFVVVGVGLAGYSLAAHQPLIVLLGVALVVAGILVALFSKQDTVMADRAARQLSITFSSLAHRGQAQAMSFDDVQSLQLQQAYTQVATGSTGMPGNGISFGNNGGFGFGNNGVGNGGYQTELVSTLSIIQKSGSVVTIASEQHQVGAGLGINTGGNLQNSGQLLADAIGVPLQVAGAPTAGQMMSTLEGAFRQPTAATAASQPVRPPVPPVSSPTPAAQPAPLQPPLPPAPPAQPPTPPASVTS